MTDTDVLALEERRRQAMLAGDLDALQALLADDLTYGHSSGGTDDKAAYLAKLSGGGLRYLAVELLDLRVQPLPQAALVHGRMRATIRKDGTELAIASRFMTVWSPDATGTWQLRAHQGTSAAG